MNMFKDLCAAVAALFMLACGSPHRRFHGPIAEPVWTIPDLAITQQPVIHEGVIYAFGNPPSTTKVPRHLYAFDMKTQKQLWVSAFSPVGQIKFIAGPRLFVADDQGIGHTLDRKTGQDLAPAAPTSMVRALVSGDSIYSAGKHGSVTAMDYGLKTRWTAQAPLSPNSLVDPVVSGGNVIVFGDYLDESEVNHGCGIYAFDVKDGTLRWKWETRQDQMLTHRMVADSNTVYASIHGKAQLVLAFNASTGEQKWANTSRPDLFEGPFLYDASTVMILDYPPPPKQMYPETGFLVHAIKAATGEPLWELKTPWKYYEWQPYDGSLLVADKEDHSWTSMYSHPVYPWPTDSWLTRFDLRTGKELWRSKVSENAFFTQPAIGEGLIVIGCAPWIRNSKPAGLFAFRASKDGK